MRPSGTGDNGGVSSDNHCGADFQKPSSHKNSSSSKVPRLTFNVSQSLTIRPSVSPPREPLASWLTFVRVGVWWVGVGISLQEVTH